MSILDRFKKEEDKKGSSKSAVEKKKVKNKKDASKKKVEKSKARVESNAYRVLINPLISEKTTDLGQENKYVFKVSKKANKEEIKQAIKDVYGIKPLSVKTVNVIGKKRRYGRVLGKTSDYKKAIISLPEGETIQIYEGV
jgi:large subunit ribosomal protein L23